MGERENMKTCRGEIPPLQARHSSSSLISTTLLHPPCLPLAAGHDHCDSGFAAYHTPRTGRVARCFIASPASLRKRKARQDKDLVVCLHWLVSAATGSCSAQCAFGAANKRHTQNNLILAVKQAPLNRSCNSFLHTKYSQLRPFSGRHHTGERQHAGREKDTYQGIQNWVTTCKFRSTSSHFVSPPHSIPANV